MATKISTIKLEIKAIRKNIKTLEPGAIERAVEAIQAAVGATAMAAIVGSTGVSGEFVRAAHEANIRYEAERRSRILWGGRSVRLSPELTDEAALSEAVRFDAETIIANLIGMCEPSRNTLTAGEWPYGESALEPAEDDVPIPVELPGYRVALPALAEDEA